jgi:internalin A
MFFSAAIWATEISLAQSPVITNLTRESEGFIVIQWDIPTNRCIAELSTNIFDNSSCVQSTSNSVTTELRIPYIPETDRAFYRLQVGLQAVRFPDPAFKEMIATNIYIKHEPTNEIYDIDITDITTLNGSFNGITDMEGLQYCTGMQEITFYENHITNIPPLIHLTNLTHVAMNRANLIDLSAFGHLSSLTHLELSENYQLSDISSLDTATNLQHLILGSGSVSNIDSLSYLSSLDLLWLADNQITNLSPLSNLTNLTILSIDRNPIWNLTPLTNLSRLTSLNAGATQITNIDDLATLTNLHMLELWNNAITNLAPLVNNASNGGLGSGDTVWLQNCPLSDFALTNQIPTLTNDYDVNVIWYMQ